MTTGQWKKMAWEQFASYIKLRDSRDGGITASCVTCGKQVKLGTRDCQAGHFLQGRTKGILFDERCVHVQCWACNVAKGGMSDVYWPFMYRKYGPQVIDELLEAQARNQGSWKPGELQEVYRTYQEKVEYLKQLHLSGKLAAIAAGESAGRSGPAAKP
jgi:hypothetical protein